MPKKESKKKIQIKPKKDSKDKVIVKNTELKKVSEKQTNKKSKMFEIKLFSDLNTLKKLQIIVASIFLLSTLSIILVLVSDFAIAVFLILISYLMLFVLTIKLLITKKL
jgi:hypothetical protein